MILVGLQFIPTVLEKTNQKKMAQETFDSLVEGSQWRSTEAWVDRSSIRVLNFGGGGFDSVMQLGVAHALLVNQGKAPDVVVGMSTGAIGGAALAEILQAGQLPASGLDRAGYEKVLENRVARFRFFSDACHAAPERIVDAIFPDAYQIDSFEPLASLRLPRLSTEERNDRDNWIRRRTGLVKLYNDMLAIDLPFGAITRLIRRGLGISASKALSQLRKRILVRVVEAAKSWLVIGSQLYKLTPLVALIGRSVSGTKQQVGPTTAGSIIFKFKAVQQFLSLMRKFLSFSFLLLNWVVISWSFVALPFLLVHIFSNPPLGVFANVFYAHLALYLVPFVFRFAKMFRLIWLLVTWSFLSFPLLTFDYIQRQDVGSTVTLFNVFYILYLLPFIIPLTPAALAFDKQKRAAAFKDLQTGIFAFAIYLVKWTLVLVPVLAAIVLGGLLVYSILIILLFALFFIVPMGSSGPIVDMFQLVMAIVFVIIAMLAVIARPVLYFIRAFWSFRKSRKKGTSPTSWIFRNFLDSYGLGPALAHNYGLKQFLVELFDPDYYGKRIMPTILEESLHYRDNEKANTHSTRGDDGQDTRNGRRRLSKYDEGTTNPSSSIILAVAAADVQLGKLVVLPSKSPVVDALLAATAKTPVFEPVDIGKKLFIDSGEVGNAPTKALVEFLETVGLSDQTAVNIYPVEPLPIAAKKGPGPYAPVRGQRFLNLIDIVMRALQLQRYRDATLERDLTMVINRAIPPDRSTVLVSDGGANRTYFRAHFAPIELEHARHLNRNLFFSTRNDRRIAIGETVADGCRAAMEAMLAETLESIRDGEDHAGAWTEARQNGFVPCRVAVATARQAVCGQFPDIGSVELPGSAGDAPGLAEVCKHCRLRNIVDAAPGSPVEFEVVATQSLRLREMSDKYPVKTDWPHELEPEQMVASERPTPSSDESLPDSDKRPPIVASLFSGGVFRGVFQMGVLNAFNLAGVNPRVVAGASIGSITAAMVARALRADSQKERTERILQLSSVYLGIDRFILTDRFADFIRNWTIRASEAKFSLRQLDEVFRKYDAASSTVFQKTFREVLAGLERLLYVDPYQVNAIVRAVRNRNGGDAGKLLKEILQHWLDRMEVGQELLGAQPIRILIDEFVLPDDPELDPSRITFDRIADEVLFIATTTNLTQGTLKILSTHKRDKPVMLAEGLLASSAFPAVFRPRRSWDLFARSDNEDQFIDGGVMDNLPLYSVLRRMRKLADANEIALRPERAPHLMLAASLEVDPKKEIEVDPVDLQNYWPDLLSRAKELRYNTKLNTFARVAEGLQKIQRNTPPGYDPLKVKVVGIKPRWLCNTFAFHPMLGFRRSLQAASIAHGCAATLLALGGLEEGPDAWNLNKDAVPDVGSFDKALPKLKVKPIKRRKLKKDGRCWLSPDIQCPYSRAALKNSVIARDKGITRDWLSRIHTSCWERTTHERKR